MKPQLRFAGQQRGYLLVATLWTLATLTLAAGYFASRVNQALELAREDKLASEAQVAMESARAEALFRLGSTSLTIYGLGLDPVSRVALDGRYYRAEQGALVSLQDARGLVRLNFPEETLLKNLLAAFGVGAEHHAQLIDTLNDYTDIDDLHRLNGAEKDEYARRHLPPPANDLLVVPDQLRQIIGWRDQPALWKDGGFLDLVTTNRYVEGINLNTAPPAVLAALPGSNAEVARIILEARSRQPIVSVRALGDLAARFGRNADEWLFGYPGRGIRVTIAHPDVPWAQRYEVTLTPENDLAPWRIDSYSRVPGSERIAGIAGAKAAESDQPNTTADSDVQRAPAIPPLPPRKPAVAILDAKSL